MPTDNRCRDLLEDLLRDMGQSIANEAPATYREVKRELERVCDDLYEEPPPYKPGGTYTIAIGGNVLTYDAGDGESAEAIAKALNDATPDMLDVVHTVTVAADPAPLDLKTIDEQRLWSQVYTASVGAETEDFSPAPAEWADDAVRSFRRRREWMYANEKDF